MITRRTPIMGNGWGKKPLFAGLEAPAIAHDELIASARVVTFDVPERDFPGNRSPQRWKFLRRPKKKNLRAWRSALPATTTPLTTSIQSNSALDFDHLAEVRALQSRESFAEIREAEPVSGPPIRPEHAAEALFSAVRDFRVSGQGLAQAIYQFTRTISPTSSSTFGPASLASATAFTCSGSR